MSEFTKTPGWLDWYTGPSTPKFQVPAGAVDAHCHVFGPGAEFPFAPERKYTPCDASKAQLFALHDHVACKAQVVAQRVQLVLAGVAGRVLALGRVGELGTGAEHVAMGIHGACWHLEFGFAGAGVPVQPAGGLGEFAHVFFLNPERRWLF